MTAKLVKKWLIPKVISEYLANWTVLALEKVVLYCFRVPLEINLRFCSKLSDRCFCCLPAAMLVPIQMGTNMASPYKSSVNLANTLLRIARERKIAETWFLARLFILQLPIMSQILELIYWTIAIFSFDHMTHKNYYNLLSWLLFN